MTSSSNEDREKTKAGLKAWWSNFTRTSRSKTSKDRKGHADKVFGEPLRTSLKYASVAISIAGEDGHQYVWGYVPIIVAKVGLFLKENATEVEGVFRIAGSQKRMRELQETFDTGPRYGKTVSWDGYGYSVHDAASVLRRYLNQMPEPIVPLHLYSEFRNVMHKQPLDVEAAIKTYRLLITSMPPANRYLLLYVLDLLAVFARKSDLNRMPASNLAVIFQPGIFSHPSHLQDPNEHKIAVEVLEFLIEHQDHFLIRLSQPPMTNIDALELTSASTANELQGTPDVAELSDSDEELGVLTLHEGGGAKLARRSTTAGSGAVKKTGLLFRARRSGGSSPASNKATASGTEEAVAASTDSLPKPLLEVDGESKRAPPQGDIHEIELQQSRDGITGVGGGLRRSRTVPSRKAQETKEDKRSVSGGKVQAKWKRTASRPEDAHIASSVSKASSDVVAAETGLPTPPPSKLLDSGEGVSTSASPS